MAIEEINKLQKEIEETNKEIERLLKEAPNALNEQAMAWTDKLANRAVWVENANGYNNKYFKYLSGAIYGKADKVARISMLHPKYLKHRNIDGKKDWLLTNAEKRNLVRLMNKKSEEFEGYTNWQAVLIAYNRDNFGLLFKHQINNKYKEEYPDAFSLDYPMPNYLELK